VQTQVELRGVQAELELAREELERRRQTGAQLSTAEARLRLVMESANIGCWDWDIPTNTVYHSPEWKRQLGYEDYEITNDIGEWQDRLHPDDQERVRTAVNAFTCKPKSTYDMEFRLRHRDGSYRWIHSQGRLIVEDGKPVRLLGVHTDITERKRAAEEHYQLEAEVLRISEREQQRIAQDLHDGLGQLLTGTVHLANVLQLELAEQALPEAGEALRIIELLNQAVHETRSLARGLYPVRSVANGLSVALEELAVRTRELFKVSCSFRCPRPVRIADNSIATHLYRIAQEAITNALKHGHATHVEISLTASRERLMLNVRDDGSGISESTAGRKGMGVRIMQYRAGMMGGRLSIENGKCEGTTVVCDVPRKGQESGD
jgi:PAS domain S-box-containing protein